MFRKQATLLSSGATSLLDPLDRATQLLGSDMEDEGRGEMLLYQLNSQDHN